MVPAPFTANIAPIIITESIADDILLSMPMINSTPGIISASAIGICISGGSPICGRFSAKPGANFEMPCKIKITPMVLRSPINVASLKIDCLRSGNANDIITDYLAYNNFGARHYYAVIKNYVPHHMRLTIEQSF